MSSDFRKELAKLAESIGEKRHHSLNEEGTKLAFVLPFIRALGYDCSKPSEVTAEYIADTKSKNMDKVDYALMKDGKPIVFIECKHCGVDNLAGYHGQLASYFVSTPEVKFAVLTNGIRYLFFSDIENSNLLDPTPFLELDLTSIKDNAIELLEMFCRDRFNGDAIYEAAVEARDRQQVRDSLNKELTGPSDEFVKLVISPFFSGRMSQLNIDRYRAYVVAALNDSKADLAGVFEDGEVDVATDKHIYSRAFTEVVKGILEAAGHSTKTFVGKEKKDYIYARYRNFWICIFNFDEHKLNVKNIQFMQPLVENGKIFEGKRELRESFAISSANDIKKYMDKIIAAADDIIKYHRIYNINKRKREAEK